MLCCRGWCEFFETFVDWSWRETCNRFASATLCHPTILCVCWRVQLFMCSCNASWPFPVAGLTVILSLQSTAFTITMLMLCDADDVAECAIGISAALGSMSSWWKGLDFANGWKVKKVVEMLEEKKVKRWKKDRNEMKTEFWKFAASENTLLHCFAFYVAGCFTSVSLCRWALRGFRFGCSRSEPQSAPRQVAPLLRWTLSMHRCMEK